MALAYKTTHDTEALARLVEQFKEKSNLAAIINAYTEQTQDDEDVFWELQLERALSTAIGEQLDGIGEIVGEDRLGRSDDDYRLALTARIKRNVMSGTGNEIIEILSLLTDNVFQLDELFPAGLRITINDALTEDPNELARNLSKAAGVRATLDYTLVDDDDTFTLADGDVTQTSAAQGFASADLQGAVGEAQGAVFSAHRVTSTDAVTWTGRTTDPVEDFRAIANNASKTEDATRWVMLGENGIAMDSVDGITYTTMASPPGGTIYGVHYGAGLWVAVGAGGRIVTSPDLENWTVQTTPKAIDLHDVTYDESLDTWVAVGAADGSDAFILYATGTADDWQEATNGKNYGLNAVTSNNEGQFVACGDPDTGDAYLLKSSDGASWSEMSNPKNVRLNGVAFGGDVNGAAWVCVGDIDGGGDAYIITSTDLSSWSEQINPKNFNLNDVVWTIFDDGTGEGGWIACGDKDGSDAYLLRSRDYNNWLECNQLTNRDLYTIAAAELGGKFADSVLIS